MASAAQAYHMDCPPSTGAGVLHDYASKLYCNGDTLTDWDSQNNKFRSKYNKARKCAIHRIQAMNDYSGTTTEEIKERKSHLFPIQVAYTLGKDCLRKSSPDPGSIHAFKNEINAEIAKLISGLKSTRNDRTIEHIFGTDIEQTIMRHSNNPDDRWIQSLLGKKYGFSPSEWDIIFKGRNAHSKGQNMTKFPTENEYAFNRAKINYNLLKQRTTRKHKGGNTKYSRKRRQ